MVQFDWLAMGEIGSLSEMRRENMQKIDLGTNVFLYPMPVTLVGTIVEGKVNFMAVAWTSRVNYNPPLLAVAINKRHHTNKGIEAHRAFSVNIPSLELLEKADYCGVVSGRDQDKSGIFEVFSGRLEGAPLIRECPLCLECKLFQVVTLPTHNLYLGEIVGAYSEERFLTDGKPDIIKMKPFVLTMPDNNYWKVGEVAGLAWRAGRNWKKGS
jgi:flavin reductase (DIM6/NTAB) family NADH-FMN oxidoreductase RutF